MNELSTPHEAEVLPAWTELSAVEQSLVRYGLRGRPTAGIIQTHGMALRWEGAPDAPSAGAYPPADERALLPDFARAAAGLVARGVLGVRFAVTGLPRDSDDLVAPSDLERVLNDPATWIWKPGEWFSYWLEVSRPAYQLWDHPALRAMARTDYPAWSDLTEAQRAIVVSAMEASGMLTGLYGIWSQPEPDLTPAQRLAAVDEILEPLLPFVRDGLIEVQYRADARSTAYTVIPLHELRSAFNGGEIWQDHENAEFSEGARAVFTFVGYATTY